MRAESCPQCKAELGTKDNGWKGKDSADCEKCHAAYCLDCIDKHERRCDIEMG